MYSTDCVCPWFDLDRYWLLLIIVIKGWGIIVFKHSVSMKLRVDWESPGVRVLSMNTFNDRLERSREGFRTINNI